jgi:SM-20-related protein
MMERLVAHLLASIARCERAPAPRGAPAVFVIDGFLPIEWLELALPLLGDPARWSEAWWARGGLAARTTHEAWEALAPERRLSHHQVLLAPPRGVFDRLQAAQALLMSALGKPEVLAALAAATSAPLADTRPISTFISMRIGDFQGFHSDRSVGRRLCSALYLSDGWRPGFGGEFEMAVDGEAVFTAAPLANRIVIFDPHEQTSPPLRGSARHRIRPVEPVAGDWRRISLSAWWTAPT